MSEEVFKLKGGALIIGSLLWQDYLGKPDNAIRREWREKRLDEKSAIGIKVPIRYGRLSSGGIYTMTFANSCRGKSLGTAFVIPFQNQLTNFAQLTLEATELAAAEGMKRTFISSNGNGQPWCVLGIVFNKKGISNKNRKMITEWWQMQLSADIDFPRLLVERFKRGRESPCIHSGGLLNIPWPTPIDDKAKKELSDYDFLLATATLVTENKYPSIATLLKAVKADKDRKYFLNNYEKGIRTFQDEKVNKKLKK